MTKKELKDSIEKMYKGMGMLDVKADVDKYPDIVVQGRFPHQAELMILEVTLKPNEHNRLIVE